MINQKLLNCIEIQVKKLFTKNRPAGLLIWLAVYLILGNCQPEGVV